MGKYNSDDLPDNFCVIPWFGIEAQSMGQARVCCMYRTYIEDDDGNEMNLTVNTLSEAFNSNYMKNLRRAFLNNERPTHCRDCYVEEDAGRTSKRLYAKQQHHYLVDVPYDEIDFATDSPDKVYYLDLKFGNLCNLSCRICGAWSSSKLREEAIHIYTELSPDHKKYETDNINQIHDKCQWPRKSLVFWDDLKIHMSSVTNIEVTGGEPMLNKHHFEVLRYAVDNGYASKITLDYNTNATMLPENAIDLWKEFKRVQLAFSIDDIQDRFEFQRTGSNWDETMRVVNRAIEVNHQYPNIINQVCYTTSIFNVYYLREMYEWIESMNFISSHLNILHRQRFLGIMHMTPEAQELVLDQLAPEKFVGFNSRLIQDLDEVRNLIINGPGSTGKAFCRYLSKQDEFRGENFAVQSPEMAKAMGYNGPNGGPYV